MSGVEERALDSAGPRAAPGGSTLIKAAVNGGRSVQANAHVPVSVDEIATAARDALTAGADVVHAHARTADGGQTIAPDAVGAMVRAVKLAAPGAIVGTTTGLWTCSSHLERMRMVEAWPDDDLPDFASSAFCEEGAADAAQLVVDRGMVLESAVWSLADVPALLASPTIERNVRILIEPEDEDPRAAIEHTRAMAAAIRAAGIEVPLLYHGYDRTAWPLVRLAFADGAEVRVGFEDMIDLEDGSPAGSTAEMVRLARNIERGVRVA